MKRSKFQGGRVGAHLVRLGREGGSGLHFMGRYGLGGVEEENIWVMMEVTGGT